MPSARSPRRARRPPAGGRNEANAAAAGVRSSKPSSRQGFLRNLNVSPGLLRRGMNLWPPFRGAGIRVTRISADYREVDVTLKLGLLNRNYFGTHFGGSLYAMTDPFPALMMFRNLGSDYVVWDKAGVIRYVTPGRGTVHARMRLDPRAVERARAATADGDRHEPTFTVHVVDGEGGIVAIVEKTLHIRRLPEGRRASGASPARRKAA